MTVQDSTERATTNLLARMLYGASGLRAGWRALVFVAFMALFEW
jgi:hypothetical protein